MLFLLRRAAGDLALRARMTTCPSISSVEGMYLKECLYCSNACSEAAVSESIGSTENCFLGTRTLVFLARLRICLTGLGACSSSEDTSRSEITISFRRSDRGRRVGRSGRALTPLPGPIWPTSLTTVCEPRANLGDREVLERVEELRDTRDEVRGKDPWAIGGEVAVRARRWWISDQSSIRLPKEWISNY